MTKKTRMSVIISLRTRQLSNALKNSNAKKDIFQDYDIVYFVTKVHPFKDEKIIHKHFGQTIITQKTEDKIRVVSRG